MRGLDDILRSTIVAVTGAVALALVGTGVTPASGAGQEASEVSERPERARTPSPAHRAPFRLAALDLTVDLDYERPWVDGRAVLTVENWTAEAASQVPLLVGRLMRVEAVTGESGAEVPFDQDVTVFEDWTLRQVTAVRVHLPEPVPAGDSTRLTVHYSGHLVGATETGMRYVRDHLDPAFSVLRAEAFAFPVVTAPSLAVYRQLPRRPFRFTARVTVPDTLVVASGGEVVERTTNDGRATYHLRSRGPVPFLNLTIAPYRVLERDGIRAYLLPGDSARGPELLETIREALSFYRSRYGELPRPPAFSIMEIPDGWGAQAHLEAGIMLEGASVATHRERRHLYHELSHLWNAPDAEAPSPRWNEGLATYFGERVAAELDGTDLIEARSSLAESVCRRVRGSEGVRSTPLAEYGTERLTGWSYSVGALFFHVLHGVMGPERFDAAYRRLYQSTKGGEVSVDDLEQAFEREDPRSAAVFEDWVRSVRWHERLCHRSEGDVQKLIEGYRSTRSRQLSQIP